MRFVRKEAKIYRKKDFCFSQCLYLKGVVGVDAESVNKVPSTAPESRFQPTGALMPVTSPPCVVGRSQPLCHDK